MANADQSLWMCYWLLCTHTPSFPGQSAFFPLAIFMRKHESLCRLCAMRTMASITGCLSHQVVQRKQLCSGCIIYHSTCYSDFSMKKRSGLTLLNIISYPHKMLPGVCVCPLRITSDLTKQTNQTFDRSCMIHGLTIITLSEYMQ